MPHIRRSLHVFYRNVLSRLECLEVNVLNVNVGPSLPASPPPPLPLVTSKVPREGPVGASGKGLGRDALARVDSRPTSDPCRRAQCHQPSSAVDGARLRYVVLQKALLAQLRGVGVAVEAGGGAGRAVPLGDPRTVTVCGSFGRGSTAEDECG